MFQLWKLVLLCGLLTGTSASLLGDLGNSLKDATAGGRKVFEDTAKVVARNLKENLNRLQNANAGEMSLKVLQKAEQLLTDSVSQVLSIRSSALGLKVNNARLLNITTTPTLDGKGVNLTFPIGADVELYLPFIGKATDLKLSLDLLGGVRLETQNGKLKMVPAKCTSDPASISLSLLGRHSKLANRLVDAGSSFLSNTLSTLVEMQVCPLITYFINSLGVDFIQNAMSTLMGIQPQLPV